MAPRYGMLLAMAGLCAPLFAAEAVPVSPDLADDEDVFAVTTATAAHVLPDASADVAFDAPAGLRLDWVVQTKHDGFYRVIRRDRGPQGWIAEGDVELVHPHVHHADDVTHHCAATLDECPARGCATEATPEAESNELKRTIPPAGVPRRLSFADFAQLQRDADERVGQGPMDPTPLQRAALQDLPLASGRISEGDLVRVVAFIARGNDGLHVNQSGESVNCQLKKPADNDIHIPVVENRDDIEFGGIVVEMIPEGRPAAWNVDALKQLQKDGVQVRIDGGLSYDKVHFVIDDPAYPIDVEPDRMSLWEIHPITRFGICKKDRCDPERDSDWSEL